MKFTTAHTIYSIKLKRGSNIWERRSKTPQTACWIAFRSSKILDKARAEWYLNYLVQTISS